MSYRPAARAFGAVKSFDGVVAGQLLDDEVPSFAPDLKDILARAERSIGGSDLDAARVLLARASALIAEAAGIGAGTRAVRLGGLAPWQAKRISAHIDAHLSETIPVARLAEMAALSAGHFSRAFKQTFGDTPHGHVMRRRVEAAKAMMLRGAEPLSQIAYLCGFADQAHFSRTFRKLAGASPLAWRRANYAAA